uniref:ATP-dependent DNA helicase n=1 Tax=Brassica oleracea var. oleracea TaxID=109376 RepID=A0A0D3BYM1_BRAOL
MILDERSYDQGTLLETLERDVSKMTDEQRRIYNEIISAVNEGEEKIYLSADSIDPTDKKSVNDEGLAESLYSTEARIITGEKVGKIVDIPRLLITPSDTKLPFKMRRRQLPLAVAFAITINKSQGQSLSEVGIFLPRPVFSHGQLYVAISRVTSKKGLNILIVDKDGIPQKKTMNVVFKEIFNNL